MDLTTSYRTAVPVDVLVRYEFVETRNAAGVLKTADPEAYTHVMEVLDKFDLIDDDLILAGGEESGLAKRMNRAFRSRGWREARVDTSITLDRRLMPFREAGETEPVVARSQAESKGYKVDNMRGRIALDLEWNAKDGNLDRDLAAYRALYDFGLIDSAVLITRTQDDLRLLGQRLRREAGMSEADAKKVLSTTTTTNMDKLRDRLKRGDAGGCPVLAVGICRCTWSGWKTERDTPD
ncbi:MAG: restriction endonuclease [Actinomycetia bacterium]|nr:restriction endonuclease [Actinomycetes bacterium]